MLNSREIFQTAHTNTKQLLVCRTYITIYHQLARPNGTLSSLHSCIDFRLTVTSGRQRLRWTRAPSANCRARCWKLCLRSILGALIFCSWSQSLLMHYSKSTDDCCQLSATMQGSEQSVHGPVPDLLPPKRSLTTCA